MEKKIKSFFNWLFASVLSLLPLILVLVGPVRADEIATTPLNPIPEITPIACPAFPLGCPQDLINNVYSQRGESCASSYEDFKQDPINKHYWVEDPQVTAQGKADERARQFIYWVISHPSIDNHPTLLKLWGFTRNITYFFIILVIALFGLGYIIGQRTQFNLGIQIWPSIYKTALLLLYVTFSAAIVLFLIQLGNILMKFFIENLKGDQIFNIYFSGPTSTEKSYTDFFGCRDLNIRVQEAAQAEMFLLKATNVTYYVMGTMLVLRKIILWFMLFVSPFLALLLPFIFIRNIGWIWIGVFFQWLFYGPLLALFLGALATIWKNGIPFPFDFSRAGTTEGYVFPTAIKIYYGGPAQRLSILNNGNYIDTFAEYVITLIMLWAVTFFPWWLLRIFRDYCCDGIYAMKNILLSMFDQMRNPPSPQPPSPSPLSPSASTISTKIKIPEQIEVPVKIKLETLEEIKKSKTEEITRSLNVHARSLTDIARFETDKRMRETVTKNLNYLKNPLQAETPVEKQKFMNIKTELYQRSLKQDVLAKNIISSVSSSVFEQQKVKERVVKEIPQVAPLSQAVVAKTKIPEVKANTVISSVVNSFVSNNQLVNQLSQTTNLSSSQVQNILTSLKQQVTKKPTQVINKISQETGIEKDKVVTVLQQFKKEVKQKEDLVKQISQKENLPENAIKETIEAPIDIVAEPEKHIEQTITIPPTVSIDEYEQVKKMWVDHYERGELPVSENVTDRKQWVERDTVFITNTLNKLLSDDPKLKQEGLDDVSYILPIFLINNLSGEQLIAYLKAKLEAAKQVRELLEKEEEIKEKLKSQTEEKVEVAAKKKEETAKEMEMGMEMEEETKAEDKPKNPVEEEQTNNN
jgi:hypothetical protein